MDSRQRMVLQPEGWARGQQLLTVKKKQLVMKCCSVEQNEMQHFRKTDTIPLSIIYVDMAFRKNYMNIGYPCFTTTCPLMVTEHSSVTCLT